MEEAEEEEEGAFQLWLLTLAVIPAVGPGLSLSIPFILLGFRLNPDIIVI